MKTIPLCPRWLSHLSSIRCQLRWQPSLTLIALTCIALIGTLPARAQSDDFEDGDGDWTQYNPIGTGSYSTAGGVYLIQSSVSPDPGTFGPGRAGSLREDFSYSDFSVSYELVDWDNALNQSFGILARVQAGYGLGATDGYTFTYSTSGSLEISRIDGEAPTELGSVSLTLNPANDYRLIMTGIGSTFTGTVYDVTDPTTLLATVNGTDATYAEGINGLFVFDNSPAGDGTASATFDNYIETVPEPSTLALFALGSLGLGAMAWRRRRNR
jgi:hypothetical protein